MTSSTDDNARVAIVAARHLERHALLRRACAWRGRCAARSSAPGRETRARFRRSSGRRAGAASARRAPSVDSTGWHDVKISRSRSSPTSSSSSIAASSRGDVLLSGLRARGRARSCLRSSSLLRRDSVDRAVLGGRHQPGARIVSERPTPATARAPRPARPARDPRRGRRRARCARGSR